MLEQSGKKGLSQREAEEKLRLEGRNEMQFDKDKSLFRLFLEQMNDPLIYVLAVAALVSLLLRELADAVIICVVVLLNALVGMLQEGKARKALNALKKLASPKAIVWRDGVRKEVPAAELVVGDLVCLETGCQVPADLRLISTTHLKIEESALTGENLPVEKREDATWDENLAQEIPLGERHNMAYMSTIVTGGRGEGIVTATGMRTELGQIAALIADSEEELTPLQKNLGQLGKILSVLSLALCAILFLIAVYQKRNILQMLLVAISLAVAAVPEGLPAVVTICLALSVTRMVKGNTIIRKLPSVETLGAVSVVCSDKTGTLTKNRMTVEKFYIDGQWYPAGQETGNRPLLTDFLAGMTLCNDAAHHLGDPTETALLDFAERYGIYQTHLNRDMPRLDEIAFDSDRKMMTTFHKTGKGIGVSYTKGAPDILLEHCTFLSCREGKVRLTESHRRQIKEILKDMSREALRTLAVAKREEVSGPVEEGLTFLGIVGMRDPVRPEAVEAVETFRKAGVRTVMITGDHADTAMAIGRNLGIAGSSKQCVTGAELGRLSDQELSERIRTQNVRIFARVSPLQKVRIVRGFQAAGNIVAMTGDGVNDAPSLKIADIGIAMGKNGTDVAKQAADMILTDDNFATIEKAIEEGRGVYENIRKSVIFLLSSNLGEILTMFIAVLCGSPAPLQSSHILWINLITDSLPALALGSDTNDGETLMKNPPRKVGEGLFARGGFACTCFYGILIATISLTAFFMIPISLLRSEGIAVTVERLLVLLQHEALLVKSQTCAFTVLGMSQLFHAVGMRNTSKSVFHMNHRNNKLMILACGLGVLLQFAVTEIPVLIQAFGTAPLSLQEWERLVLLSAFPLFAHECIVWTGSVGNRFAALFRSQKHCVDRGYEESV